MPEPVVLRRNLACPERSFFLFGPRGTGKSTWLRQVLSGAPRYADDCLAVLPASDFLRALHAGEVF